MFLPTWSFILVKYSNKSAIYSYVFHLQDHSEHKSTVFTLCYICVCARHDIFFLLRYHYINHVNNNKCKTDMIPILMNRKHISTSKVTSVILRPKQFEIRKNWESCERAEKTKQSAIKLSQICRRIELCMRRISLRSEMNFKGAGHFYTEKTCEYYNSRVSQNVVFNFFLTIGNTLYSNED
jgi:hypothetical protein